MIIKTVGDLKKVLCGLPDDMPIYGYFDGSDCEPVISHWMTSYVKDGILDTPDGLCICFDDPRD